MFVPRQVLSNRKISSAANHVDFSWVCVSVPTGHDTCQKRLINADYCCPQNSRIQPDKNAPRIRAVFLPPFGCFTLILWLDRRRETKKQNKRVKVQSWKSWGSDWVTRKQDFYSSIILISEIWPGEASRFANNWELIEICYAISFYYGTLPF